MSKRSLPWLQFYPSDWLSDSVAGCSLAAQGLWFRMLFVAHNSQRYGYLEVDGKAIPDEQLSRRCGCANVEEYRSLLAELFSAGAPSRTPEGIIFSRRMARDQQDRDSAADRQRLHRSHAPVTPLSQGELRGRGQKSEVRAKQERAAKPAPPAAISPNPEDSVWTFLGIKPCGPQSFRSLLESRWAPRNGERTSVLIGETVDAWEAAEGEKLHRVPQLFRALANLREAEKQEPERHELEAEPWAK